MQAKFPKLPAPRDRLRRRLTLNDLQKQLSYVAQLWSAQVIAVSLMHDFVKDCVGTGISKCKYGMIFY